MNIKKALLNLVRVLQSFLFLTLDKPLSDTKIYSFVFSQSIIMLEVIDKWFPL